MVPGHTDRVNCVRWIQCPTADTTTSCGGFSADRYELVSGSSDHTLRVWEVSKNEVGHYFDRFVSAEGGYSSRNKVSSSTLGTYLWFCCHMLSGNCQSGPYLDSGCRGMGIHYDTNTDRPDNYQTTYDSKTRIDVFYSLSNAFDLIWTFLEVNLEK